jgi:DNA-binding NarL/FixJ family response regulator
VKQIIRAIQTVALGGQYLNPPFRTPPTDVEAYHEKTATPPRRLDNPDRADHPQSCGSLARRGEVAPTAVPQPSGGGRVRVLLADEHRIVRQGLRLLVEADPRLVVVGEAGDACATVRLAKELGPDVVVMNLRMPGTDGLKAARQIASLTPRVKVVTLSPHMEPQSPDEILQAGTLGYLSKDCTRADLVTAILKATTCQRRSLETIQGQSRDEASAPTNPGGEGATLSPRDQELLRLAAEGENTKAIAATLGLSPKTVDIYRRRLMLKLRLGSVAALTKYAIRTGLTSLDG